MKAILLLLVVSVLLHEWPGEKKFRIRLSARTLFENGAAAVAFFFLLFSLAFPADQWIQSEVFELRHPVSRFLLFVGKTIGTNIYFWLALLALYASAFIARIPHLREAAFGAMLSAGISGLGTTVLKVSTMRARPDTGFGTQSFFNMQGYLESKGAFLSFPSGDVAIVAGAAYFFLQRTNSLTARVIFFLLPLLTALSRISLARHWPSDTIASLFLGGLSAYLVCGFLQSSCKGTLQAQNP